MKEKDIYWTMSNDGNTIKERCTALLLWFMALWLYAYVHLLFNSPYMDNGQRVMDLSSFTEYICMWLNLITATILPHAGRGIYLSLYPNLSLSPTNNWVWSVLRFWDVLSAQNLSQISIFGLFNL